MGGDGKLRRGLDGLFFRRHRTRLLPFCAKVYMFLFVSSLHVFVSEFVAFLVVIVRAVAVELCVHVPRCCPSVVAINYICLRWMVLLSIFAIGCSGSCMCSIEYLFAS